MVKNPLITIILTTFKRAHLVEGMLNSVKDQIFTNWECIIIDDNSNDDTSKIVSQVINLDERFKFIIKPKENLKGLPASRNIGIKEAKGKFIVFFDDDDIVHPELLNICINEFTKNEKLGFVHYQKKTFIGNFNKNGLAEELSRDKEIISENIFEKVIIGNLPMASCTVMWNIDLLKNNLFNESLMYAEEWECYSRILILNDIIGLKLEAVLYFNRKHTNSNTGEFADKNPVRIQSYIKAHVLLSSLLIAYGKMNKNLKKYFFNKSYILKSKNIVSPILKNSFTNKLSYIIFPLKYKIYALLKSKTNTKKI